MGLETFVIPIDSPINMIAAYLNTTWQLEYHGTANHFNWQLQFSSSNGLATTPDGGALKTVVSGPIVSLPNGNLLYASWD